MIKKVYIKLGRFAYIIAIPLMWFLLSKRVRSYAFIEQDSRVLLVKNWLSNGDWVLPGGGSHSDETALQAVIREVEEELSVVMEPTKTRFLKEGFKKRKFGGKHYALFHYDLPLNSTVIMNKTELVDIAWIPLPSIRSTPNMGYEVLAALASRDDVTA